MSEYKQLLKRAPVHLIVSRLSIRDRFTSIFSYLFHPEQMRRKMELIRAVNTLRIEPFTPQSVKAYINAMSEDFFWEGRSLGLYEDQKKPRLKFHRFILRPSHWPLPTPLNKLKNLLPPAEFMGEYVEVNNISVATLILVRHGDVELYLYLLQERKKCSCRAASLSS